MLMLGFGLGLSDANISMKPPYPPPNGYRWSAVTEKNFLVTEQNKQVFSLVRAA